MRSSSTCSFAACCTWRYACDSDCFDCLPLRDLRDPDRLLLPAGSLPADLVFAAVFAGVFAGVFLPLP